jgi:hypothetical protein
MKRDFCRQALCLTLLAGAHAALNYTGDFCAGVVDFPLKDGSNIARLDSDAENMVSQFPRWVDKVNQRHGLFVVTFIYPDGGAGLLGRALEVRLHGVVWRSRGRRRRLLPRLLFVHTGRVCSGKSVRTLPEGVCLFVTACVVRFSCKQTIELLGDLASTYVSVLQLSCFSQPVTPTCHTGGTAFTAAGRVFVLPLGLISALVCRAGAVTYQNVPDDYQVFCPKPLGLAEPRDGLHMEKLDGTACALPCPPVR